MKALNVTSSNPENINLEKAKVDKNTLKNAFKAAENDPDLKETINDWAALDGVDWDVK